MDEEKNIIDEEIAKLEKELEELLKNEDNSNENTSDSAQEQQEEVTEEEPKEKEVEKKGDLSKAVKEKNRKIKELKQKLAEYEAKLKQIEEQKLSQPAEGERQEIQPEAQEVVQQVAPQEDLKVVASDLYEEVNKINSVCAELEQKYKNEPYPFNKLEVLAYIYNKATDIKDVSIIEDVYLALKAKKVAELRELEEKRKNASTETTSGFVSSGIYEPKNLKEAFELIKTKKT